MINETQKEFHQQLGKFEQTNRPVGFSHEGPHSMVEWRDLLLCQIPAAHRWIVQFHLHQLPPIQWMSPERNVIQKPCIRLSKW